MARLGPARWLAIPLLALPVSWLLFTGLGRDPRDIASPLVGHPVPTFIAATLDGRTVSSTHLASRPMIVNFWASWCTPCVDEHPVLLDAARHYAGRLTVIGVIYQDTPEGAADFLARWGDGGWANLLDGNGRIAVDFGVTGPPETFFVGADGVVRARHIGPLTNDVMAEQLAALGLDR
jgi:cytochrome c biogenesis protein CcmG/thiol:disulfide interchange protein DsbE